MEHMIKMAGFDLDGTLLTVRKELTYRTRKALEKVSQKGVSVLVATGRPWRGVTVELQSLRGMR